MWAEEARKRWAACKAGKVPTVSLNPSWPSTANRERCLLH
ncbi:MAG: hypothetical protein ACREQ7_23555 [Candidatus Binatia bacterium]